MKSFYNLLKKPFTHYLKKDILRRGVKGKNILTQKIKTLEIKDKIRISNRGLNEKKSFSYKPSIIHLKINDDFNYINQFKLNDFNQFGIKKIGLSNLLYRQFSTKVDRINNPAPHIHTDGDFGELVKQSSTFVDKSLFVNEIIKHPSEVILITMPPRWGKSLNLDMLKRFLSIEVDKKGNTILNNQNENYKLFAGGKIEVMDGYKKIQKEIPISELVVKIPKSLNLQGQYPVIYMDFKDCKGENFEELIFKLKKKITETIQNFGYLAKSKKAFSCVTTIGQKYKELLNEIDSGILEFLIKELCSLLYSYHDKSVWILIDEYDAPVNEAFLKFSDKDAKTVLELFLYLYEITFKGNSFLEKGVLVGVQDIVKNGITSGFNNLSKQDLTSIRYSKYFGIDQKEINLLLNHFNIDEQHALKIKNWYNGYKSNITSIQQPNFIDKYNIWSVVNYLNKQNDGFKPYLEKSALVSELLQKLIKNESLRKTFEDLVNGETIVIRRPMEEFDIYHFKKLKAIKDSVGNKDIREYEFQLIYSYLYITGYLARDEFGYSLLPNKEIHIEMSNYLKDYYTTIFNIPTESFNDLTLLLDQIFYKDIKEASNIFIKEFGPKLEDIIKNLQVYNNDNDALTVKGLFENEDLMHSLLNNIIFQVVNPIFASERLTTKFDKRKGRADIVLSKNDKSIVIEMKYNNNAKKSEDIKNLAKNQVNEALEQAKSYSKLVENTPIQIFIGCNITDKQEIFLSGDIIMEENKSINFDYPFNNI